MKVDIISFSTFDAIVESKTNTMFGQLIGTQCIYPYQFQTPILNTFLKEKKNSDDDSEIKEIETDYEFKFFCFQINDVHLYPKYTYSDSNITTPIIVVSDYFYEKHFQNKPDDHILNIIYDIPSVDIITLKRTDGNFPKDDSLEYLLTDYFESCSIVNLKQNFKLSLFDDSTIEFQVDNITYKKELQKDIKQRIEEIDLMIKFNMHIAKEYNLTIPQGYGDSESIVTNYEWHYNTLGKKIPTLGYLVNNEIKIDFIVSEKILPEPKLTPEPEKILPDKLNKTEPKMTTNMVWL